MLVRVLTTAVLLCGGLVAATTPPASSPATQPYKAATLDDAYRELRARGSPATMDDLQPATIADNQNGAVYLARAGAAVVPEKSGPRNSSFDYGPWLPYPREWYKLAEESVTANAASLELVRKGRACGDKVSWDLKAGAAPADQMQQTLKGLTPLRTLANVVTDEALLEHFNGDEAGAFETTRDARYLIEANTHRAFLVSNLVTLGLRAMVAQNYLLIGTKLQIADGTPAGKGKGVDRQVVKETIAWLLDDAAIREQARRSMAQERVYGLADAKARGYAANPMWQKDLPAILGLYDELARQMDQAAWEPAKLTSKPAGSFAPLYDTLTKSMERWRFAMHRIIMEQRIAAVGLAAGLYRHDKGSYPQSLQDLVPDYLPGLPIDAYSRTGEPLLYTVLDGGKRPRLGTVGPDGVDAGLHDAPPPKAVYGINFGKPGEVDDAWVDLSAWNPDAVE